MNNKIQSIEIINKNYKRAYDYHLTLFKNDYPTQNAVGKEKNTYTYIPYNLNENEYIFYNFKYWDIGASVALSEDDYMVYEGKRLNYCCFEYCNIKNVVFRNCSFSGSKFLKVKFERVIFDNCKFTVPVCENGKGVEELYYAPCIFTQCIFWCDFTDGDKVMLGALHDKLMGDDKLASSARTSDPRIFAESIFPAAFGTAAMDSYMESQDSYSSLFEDKNKYNAIMGALAGVIYREMRSKDPTMV